MNTSFQMACGGEMLGVRPLGNLWESFGQHAGLWETSGESLVKSHRTDSCGLAQVGGKAPCPTPSRPLWTQTRWSGPAPRGDQGPPYRERPWHPGTGLLGSVCSPVS